MFSVYKKMKVMPILLLLGFFTLGFFAPLSQVGLNPTVADFSIAHAQYRDLTEETASDLTSTRQNFGCFGDGTPDSSRIAGCVAAGAYYLMFVPANWIAGLMGVFFNFVLYKLVVGMGVVYETDLEDGVMSAWTALRDIANIFLVFLTVYIGIATILNISGYGYKQLLWRVILAAIFVNFSITITKVVIDVSNFAALEVYALFIESANEHGADFNVAECTNPRTAAALTDASGNRCVSHGLASVFWSELKIMTAFNLQAAVDMADSNSGAEIQWKMALTAVMSAIMFIVLAFLLGVAGFLFVTRFVILIVLLVLSPIALVALLTGVSGQGKKWWGKLIDQSFFAPLLLLMWWVAYVIMNGFMDEAESVASFFEASALGIIVNFIIIMGFLIAGLIIAKSLGAAGAGASIRLGNKWARGSAAFVAGGAAAYGLGGMSRYMSKNYTKVMALAEEKNADGSYKYNTPTAVLRRKLSGGVIDRSMNKAIDAGANTKFFGTKSFADRRTATEKAAKERKGDVEKVARGRELKGAIASKKPEDVERTRKIMRETSYDNLMEHRDLIAKNPASIAHVNSATYKRIIENKDKKFSDQEILKLKKARADYFMNMSAKEAQKEIGASSPKDLAEHDRVFLGRKDVVQNLDPQTLNGMIRNGLSREKRDAIRTTVEAQYKEIMKKQGGGSGLLVDAQGKSYKTNTDTLTKEEKNIAELYEWFNNDNRLSI